MISEDSSWLKIDQAGRSVSIDSTDPRFFDDPYATYERIRAVMPAFFWEEHRLWCFLNAADVGAILRDRRFGRELLPPPGQPAAPTRSMPSHVEVFHAVNRDSMLEREPPVHTRLRTLVNRAFVSRSVERLRPRIAGLAHELVDRVEPFRKTDLIQSFATPIPVVVIAELLGVPSEMAPQLLDWSHRMVAMFQLGRTREMEDSAEAATKEFSSFLRQYVGERRKRPADDLITHLLAAEAADDRLSEDELIATCILLLNAGHEATVHAIGNSVKTLLEERTNPVEAFAGDPATEATVEECLRFDPPLHLFNRVVQEDVEVAGISLPRGSEVALLYGAANRDPARYPRAQVFDPKRPLAGASFSHTAFGGGIHFCLGAPLARLELQVSLPILFRRLPGLHLQGRPHYRDNYHFHGLQALDVGWG
ncbi:MAG TPA: cytochrome P450 [Opitutaceae bacterium]|jgi:cytochrome P450